MKQNKLYTICLIILLSMFTGCSSANKLENETEFIEKIFPEFGKFQVVSYIFNQKKEKGHFLEDILLPITLDAEYIIQGFALLDERKAIEIFEDYSWEEINLDLSKKAKKFKFNKFLNLNGNWLESKEFSNKHISDRFKGLIFVDKNKKVVYFDILISYPQILRLDIAEPPEYRYETGELVMRGDLVTTADSRIGIVRSIIHKNSDEYSRFEAPGALIGFETGEIELWVYVDGNLKLVSRQDESMADKWGKGNTVLINWRKQKTNNNK